MGNKELDIPFLYAPTRRSANSMIFFRRRQKSINFEVVRDSFGQQESMPLKPSLMEKTVFWKYTQRYWRWFPRNTWNKIWSSDFDRKKKWIALKLFWWIRFGFKFVHDLTPNKGRVWTQNIKSCNKYRLFFLTLYWFSSFTNKRKEILWNILVFYLNNFYRFSW